MPAVFNSNNVTKIALILLLNFAFVHTQYLQKRIPHDGGIYFYCFLGLLIFDIVVPQPVRKIALNLPQQIVQYLVFCWRGSIGILIQRGFIAIA